MKTSHRTRNSDETSKGLLGRIRRGASTVELAVCLPILFLFAMGAMEASSMIFLRQALVQSAYETVKESVRINGSQAEGRIRGEQVLDFRNISGHSISFDPSNVDDLEPGEIVTVTVSAPGDANTLFPFAMFTNRQVSVQASMLKE